MEAFTQTVQTRCSSTEYKYKSISKYLSYVGFSEKVYDFNKVLNVCVISSFKWVLKKNSTISLILLDVFKRFYSAIKC